MKQLKLAKGVEGCRLNPKCDPGAKYSATAAPMLRPITMMSAGATCKTWMQHVAI